MKRLGLKSTAAPLGARAFYDWLFVGGSSLAKIKMASLEDIFLLLLLVGDQNNLARGLESVGKFVIFYG